MIMAQWKEGPSFLASLCLLLGLLAVYAFAEVPDAMAQSSGPGNAQSSDDTPALIRTIAETEGASVSARGARASTSLGYETDATAECWAFGDSLVAGQIPSGDGGGHSDYNYPAMTARRLGMVLHNQAKGGSGVVKDNDAINEMIDGLDMSRARLIIVGYGGYNESTTIHDTPMGSYTDKEEDSFVGYYYRLMAKLQRKCPYATVVYVSGPGSFVNGARAGEQFTALRQFADGEHSWGDLYDELEAMCNLNGWPCVNQHHVGSAVNMHNSEVLVGSDNKHFTDEGYKTYGNFLSAKIASCYSNLA